MEINNMQYPLTEKIGSPDLQVGRESEFNNFNKWIANIPKRLSKSWAFWDGVRVVKPRLSNDSLIRFGQPVKDLKTHLDKVLPELIEAAYKKNG